MILHNPVYRRLLCRWIVRAHPAAWKNLLRYCLAGRGHVGPGSGQVRYHPLSIVLWVTARCNKACSFCHYRGCLNPPNHEEYELSLERFRDLADHPLVSSALRISLYGGEPLLNADLFRIIRDGRSRGHLMTLNTNGLLLSERREELLKDSPDMISIGYDPGDQGRMSGVIKQISERLPVRLIHILDNRYAEAIPAVMSMAEAEGVSWVSFERACARVVPGAKDSGGEFKRGNAPVFDDADDFQRLRAEIGIQYGRRIAITWPAPDGNEAGCRSFWHTLFVDASGSVAPCCLWPLTAYDGNIFEDPRIWDSEGMRARRKRLMSREYDSMCRVCSYLYRDSVEL